MNSKAEQIAHQLLQIGAVRLNVKEPFTWSSGLRSPIYCDNRLLLSYPEIRTLVRDMFVEAALNWHSFDCVAGVATAGIPHGTLLADQLNKPFIYVRSSAKGHGRRNQIEGRLVPGSEVLLIEDLISTGGSSLKAAQAVQESGSKVMGVLAIFSYGFYLAHKAFNEAKVPFRTLITLDNLLHAAKNGGLSPTDIDLIRTWRMDPKGWSNRVAAN